MATHSHCCEVNSLAANTPSQPNVMAMVLRFSTRIVTRFSDKFRRNRDYTYLVNLDDHMLRDMGLCRKHLHDLLAKK